MRQLFYSCIAIAALAACGPTPVEKAPPEPQAIEPFDLHIDVGRYGAMLHTVSELTAERAYSASVDDVVDARSMARDLRENAWEYNLLRSRLCARNIHPEASCGPAFNPVWLADPADAEVSLEEIRTRNQAFGAEINPLWGAVCDEAAAQVPEDEKMSVCPVE